MERLYGTNVMYQGTALDEFDIIFLDKPDVSRYDPYFVEIYVNLIMTYKKHWIVSRIYLEDYHEDILTIRTEYPVYEDNKILENIVCLAYLTKSRILVPGVLSSYAGHDQGCIIYPVFPHICIFNSCLINALKVETLLEPTKLLDYKSANVLLHCDIENSVYPLFMEFVNNYQKVHDYYLESFPRYHPPFYKCPIDIKDLFMILYYMIELKPENNLRSFKYVLEYIHNRYDYKLSWGTHRTPIIQWIPPTKCYVIRKLVEKKVLDKIKILKFLMDEDLSNLDKLIKDLDLDLDLNQGGCHGTYTKCSLPSL